MTDPNDTPVAETADESTPSRNPAKLALVAAVVAVLAGGGWYLYSQGKLPGLGGAQPAATAAKAPVAAPVDGLRVLAEVNGKTITAEEVASVDGNQGLDRAVAVDRLVTRVLAAEAATEMYPGEAKAVKAAAEREVLANLYSNRRSQELLQAVTDTDIDRFYKEQVRDADYASYKLNYYLTQDNIDAATMERNIAANDAEAKAKFKPVPAEGDGFRRLADTPYGLGQLVASAKAGDYLRAVRVRDGFLILHIEQVRAGKKPAQTKEVKDEIRDLIAQRRLNDELLERREKAQVKLKL
ncbi:MAG: peptidylprolyl isomerase [Gammaproteobacteria bacterium]